DCGGRSIAGRLGAALGGRSGGPCCHRDAAGEWRNWQTRRIQVPVGATPWRFKSSLAHSTPWALLTLNLTESPPHLRPALARSTHAEQQIRGRRLVEHGLSAAASPAIRRRIEPPVHRSGCR